MCVWLCLEVVNKHDFYFLDLLNSVAIDLQVVTWSDLSQLQVTLSADRVSRQVIISASDDPPPKRAIISYHVHWTFSIELHSANSEMTSRRVYHGGFVSDERNSSAKSQYNTNINHMFVWPSAEDRLVCRTRTCACCKTIWRPKWLF